LHLTKIRIWRAQSDFTRQPGNASLDTLKQFSISLKAAMHLPVTCNELSTHALDDSVGEKPSDYSDPMIFRSILIAKSAI
jgi:hypothetical protein